MTREEAIEFGNMWLQINEDCKDSSTYEFFQMAIKELEKETVSKEVYDHEYFLRKEFELKIDKLQRQLDKIFCIVHPLSIMSTMSTPELEHNAIMQIAEILEPQKSEDNKECDNDELSKLLIELAERCLKNNSDTIHLTLNTPKSNLHCYIKFSMENKTESESQENDIEKRKEWSHKPCINFEDGCEDWAGCPCVYYKAESEDKE